MSTEPETTAAEAIPVPSPDLSAAASPPAEAVSATASADGGAAAESQLPGPVPGEAAGPPAPPAAEDAAPGPGSTPAAPPARVSLRELEARISPPLQCQDEPSWPDLMQRAAADEEPWRGITDTLIAAGHAEMPARQWLAWFGDRPMAAAA